MCTQGSSLTSQVQGFLKILTQTEPVKPLRVVRVILLAGVYPLVRDRAIVIVDNIPPVKCVRLVFASVYDKGYALRLEMLVVAFMRAALRWNFRAWSLALHTQLG